MKKVEISCAGRLDTIKEYYFSAKNKQIAELKASGAIHSGIILLLRQRNLTVDEIDTFYVAGGFGSFIKPEAAQRIGLLPKTIPLERVRFCGNTSLAGARLALVNTGFRAAASELARRAKHVELATLPDFATVFAESMIF